MTKTNHEAANGPTLAVTEELSKQAQVLLRLVSRAERLETLPRTGWLACGIKDPESIASHSYVVTLIALWICDHIDQEVDTERVLRMALLHDLGEAMLTDLPWPVKQFIGAEAIEEAEARAAQTVLSGSGEGWTQPVQEYHERRSLESRIVKGADLIQMMAKACQYASQNHGDTERFWHVDKNFDDQGIPLVAAIMAELRAHHDQQTWYGNDFA